MGHPPKAKAKPEAKAKSKARAKPHAKAKAKPKPRPGGGSSGGAVPGPIQHVVFLIKENHCFDNYFGTFPGANGAKLPHAPNPPTKDPNHTHAHWLTRKQTATALQYVEADIPAYFSYARQFTLCDNYYTDVAGPSTPNHLMLIMADSALVDNPSHSYRKNPGPPVYDQPSLPSQLDAAGQTWGNYSGYAFEFIKYTAGKQRTWQQFATDAAARKLPSVSWLYSDGTLSEHPADTAAERKAGAGNVTKGSDWTASQVQAVVAAGLWPQVAIFITWDDWGGWWDHVAPSEVEKWTDGTQFRFGGRVGCLV